MYDLLKENSSEHIKIFAGGGGTILPEEIKELEDYGIKKYIILMMEEKWDYKA